MGVKKLFTFLDKKKIFDKHLYLSDIIDSLNIDKDKFIIGVDANLYCYKYSYSYGNMFVGFYNQILKFYSNNIIPIYIFDGGTIKEKETTNLNRHKKINLNKEKINEIENLTENDQNNIELDIIKDKLKKKSIKITNIEVEPLIKLFDLLNVPFIFSYCEGEYLAVLLNKLGIIDMFLTDDTDPIPAGIKKIIKFSNNSVHYLDRDLLLNNLKINQNQLIDMCILMGNDYNNFYHKIDSNIIYENIIKYKSIENIIENVDELYEENEEVEEIICEKHVKIKSFIKELKQSPENIDNIENTRNIYKNLYNYERESFINEHKNDDFDINNIVNHEDINNYSNIMLELWSDFIKILRENNSINLEKSDKFKTKVNKMVKNSNFQTDKIVNFMKQRTKISLVEIINISNTFDYLNKFGIGN